MATLELNDIKFKFDNFLRAHWNLRQDPDRPVCHEYVRGYCSKGHTCPNRHPPQVFSHAKQGSIVCKHWLRGLCKKDAQCEFLHEYNLKKMPPCHHFQSKGWCNAGEECLYLHIDLNQRRGVCGLYDAGFCPYGPSCSMRHVKRTLCKLYLTGFCPSGPKCALSHPAFPPPLVHMTPG